MTDIIIIIQWIQHYKLIVKWSLRWILTEFYLITFQIKKMRLKTNSIKVEKTG